jgi:hypothetical protein
MENDQREELTIFNEKWDEAYNKLNAQFQEAEEQIKKAQELELQQRLEEFERTYPQIPKPSVDLLNLNKILENAVKQKE